MHLRFPRVPARKTARLLWRRRERRRSAGSGFGRPLNAPCPDSGPSDPRLFVRRRCGSAPAMNGANRLWIRWMSRAAVFSLGDGLQGRPDRMKQSVDRRCAEMGQPERQIRPGWAGPKKASTIVCCGLPRPLTEIGMPRCEVRQGRMRPAGMQDCALRGHAASLPPRDRARSASGNPARALAPSGSGPATKAGRPKRRREQRSRCCPDVENTRTRFPCSGPGSAGIAPCKLTRFRRVQAPGPRAEYRASTAGRKLTDLRRVRRPAAPREGAGRSEANPACPGVHRRNRNEQARIAQACEGK